MTRPNVLWLMSDQHNANCTGYAGKPQFMQDYVANPGDYPMAEPDKAKLQRALASYYALIAKIDEEIGRVIYYTDKKTGELYDRGSDPGELDNLWDHPDYAAVRMELMQQVLDYHMRYTRKTDAAYDQAKSEHTRYCFAPMVQKHLRYYSVLMDAYTKPTSWPPSK